MVESSFDFSSKASLTRLKEIANVDTFLDESLLSDLDMLWKTNIPSKNQVFGWRLWKLPTRVGLANIWVLSGRNNLVCPLCLAPEKTSMHMFLRCPLETHV